jgi:hemolysin III
MDDRYPAYPRSARIADGTIHALGAVLALTGTTLLIVFAALTAKQGTQIAAVAIYGGALTLSLIVSGLYHFTPWERTRAPLRRMDHAAIYLKIAGTYTPIVVLIGSAFSYVVLAVVWALALAGAVSKLAFWQRPGRFGPVLYLLLGWLSLLLIWPLIQTLPVAASVLCLIGGVLYSAGVIFFNWDRFSFAMPIWHGFVLAASGCFFAAISLALFSLPM